MRGPESFSVGEVAGAGRAVPEPEFSTGGVKITDQRFQNAGGEIFPGAAKRSHSGGERGATIYTLVGTAKLNGLDPEAYLRHVIARIAGHPVNRVDELLPWVVADQLHHNIA